MYFEIKCDNIDYRGEGNCNLVISLKKEEQVLMVPKADSDCKIIEHLEVIKKKTENEIEIIEKVMKQLLAKDVVCCPLIVLIHADNIRMINNKVGKYRPVHRIHKSVKEEDTYALLLPDYCSLPPSLKIYASCNPVMCIEIKPKQGFMKKLYHPSIPSPRFLKCYYCMMQYHKERKGLISTRSCYCPIDLFSGCPSRMLHAVKMLLKTPQNNIRVFLDRTLVYAEEKKDGLEEILHIFFGEQIKSRYFDIFCDLIVRILLIPFVEVNNIFEVQKEALELCTNSHSPCSANDPCHKLPVGCILERVLNLQLLDNINVTDIYHSYLELKHHTDKFSSNIGCFSRSEIPPFIGQLEKMPVESDYQFASRKVWEFLIALTFKDISIMLVMQQRVERSDASISKNIVYDDCGNAYLFSIAIADLSSKPLSKIEKNYDDLPSILKSCCSE